MKYSKEEWEWLRTVIKGEKKMENAVIEGYCDCGFGFVETGLGDNDRPIISIYFPDGTFHSNRKDDEDMDDMEMICVRCGAFARFGSEVA